MNDNLKTSIKTVMKNSRVNLVLTAEGFFDWMAKGMDGEFTVLGDRQDLLNWNDGQQDIDSLANHVRRMATIITNK